ncbi:MAG: RagB/SusD family nutrient uptake outer membrane protein [Allomuricauda sp.]
MQLKNLYIKTSQIWDTRYRHRAITLVYLSLLLSIFYACDDFVEVDLPKDQLVADAVFEDVATATAALANIYSLMRDSGLATGSFALDYQMGLYSDELDFFSENADNLFYDHGILPTNTTITNWWDHTYNLIYAANSVIEGVENSVTISLEDKNQLQGEGLFIRTYLHSLLVNLYGAIPYVATTDYITNTSVSRMPVDKVYEQIIADLVLAESLLGEDITGERVRPYKDVANALLARMYLYTEQWALAENTATKVIDNFVLESDLSQVFRKNASGSIWQFKPDSETGYTNTREAEIFIIEGTNPTNNVTLTNVLIAAFEPNDQRFATWVGSVTDGIDTWYFPFKYKERAAITNSLEYSILFRLAEQYLIRAEARANLNDITGAQSDLNMIRARAGLSNTTATTTDDLVDAILQERQVELFTEKGQRWFDLLRLGKATEVLSLIKSNWADTDIILPIPESAILVNSNLLPQNEGY